MPVVIMPMNFFDTSPPTRWDCFFSAWVRAGPSYRVTTVTGHTDPGALLTCCTAGATPPLWCSASGSTHPTESWESIRQTPVWGRSSRCLTSIFQMAKVMKDRNKISLSGCVPDWRRPRRHKVRRQVDPGLDLGVGERVLLVAWWLLEQHLWRS